VEHLAFEHTPQTDESGEVEKHNGVAGFQPDVERPSIVAVDDPCIAADECLDLCAPLVGRRWLPPRPPIQRIEVDEGKSGALGQPPGDGGLPGSSRADDEDAPQLSAKVGVNPGARRALVACSNA
jgi:hypothetical protein